MSIAKNRFLRFCFLGLALAAHGNAAVTSSAGCNGSVARSTSVAASPAYSGTVYSSGSTVIHSQPGVSQPVVGQPAWSGSLPANMVPGSLRVISVSTVHGGQQKRQEATHAPVTDSSHGAMDSKSSEDSVLRRESGEAIPGSSDKSAKKERSRRSKNKAPKQQKSKLASETLELTSAVVEVPDVLAGEELEFDVKFAMDDIGRVDLDWGEFETPVEVTMWSDRLIRVKMPEAGIKEARNVEILFYRPDGYLIQQRPLRLITRRTIRRVRRLPAPHGPSQDQAEAASQVQTLVNTPVAKSSDQ